MIINFYLGISIVILAFLLYAGIENLIREFKTEKTINLLAVFILITAYGNLFLNLFLLFTSMK